MAELTEDEVAYLKVVTTIKNPIRASFVKVMKAELNDLNDQMEYSVQCLVPKSATETIKDLQNAAKMAFKQGVVKGFWEAGKLPGGFKNPLRDGDKAGGVALGGLPDGTEPGDKVEYNNHYFFNCKNTKKIVVKDQKNRDIIDDETIIKSGDYVRISLVAYPYNKKSKGIAFSLRGIQLLKEGEALGGGGSAANDFGEVPMSEDMGDTGDELDDMFSKREANAPF